MAAVLEVPLDAVDLELSEATWELTGATVVRMEVIVTLRTRDAIHRAMARASLLSPERLSELLGVEVLAISPPISFGIDTSICYDTAVGELDSNSQGCETYREFTTFCGSFDDDDFTAGVLCCACGGGSTYVPSTSPTLPPSGPDAKAGLIP